jgi:hypothetical protein
LTSFDGIGPAGTPRLRLGYGSSIGLGGRLSWLGPAFGARPSGDRGSAAVRQELLTLDLVYAPLVDWAGFSPLLWIGAGAYHLYADGNLAPPLIAQSDEVWAFAGALGAGLGYRLTPEVMATVDVEALLTAPRAQVTIAGEPIGSSGRPSLDASLGITVRF